MAELQTLNVNVGVLGHVDSGKTSLVAALSTTLSTAALDKHPQSRERGITLDLGFSSFTCSASQVNQSLSIFDKYQKVQFTLVDCPGHASLIRTVVGGAQIMDMGILVVDVTKGIQPQTAECLVLAEITTSNLVVALNKIDLIPPDKRNKYVRKAMKLIQQTLAVTKFHNCPIVPVSAQYERMLAENSVSDEPHEASSRQEMGGIEQLKLALLDMVGVSTSQEMPGDGPFIFYVDHCFSVKGQGTVLTGTVALGRAKVGDSVELASLKEVRKIKSMQVFRRPVLECKVGDRVGICVTQLDAKAVERGILCTPNSVPSFAAAIVSVRKVAYYAGDVRSGAKIHIITGHQTVMGKLTFMKKTDSTTCEFDLNSDYEYQEQLDTEEGSEGQEAVAALVEFDEVVFAPKDALIIGAKLDVDLNVSTCRIAFSGKIVLPISSTMVQQLHIYKKKYREGIIERIEADGKTAICRGMFGKDSDLTKFLGLVVNGPAGQRGILQSTFGKSGKFKAFFPSGISVLVTDSHGPPDNSTSKVTLEYKRYLHSGKSGGKLNQ